MRFFHNFFVDPNINFRRNIFLGFRDEAYGQTANSTFRLCIRLTYPFSCKKATKNVISKLTTHVLFYFRKYVYVKQGTGIYFKAQNFPIGTVLDYLSLYGFSQYVICVREQQVFHKLIIRLLFQRGNTGLHIA